MRKWIVGLILLVTLCIASQAKAQSIVQTYLDPCDSKVYIVNVPLNSTGVVVIIRGQSKIFSYAQFQSGEVNLWVASIFAIPCPLPPAVAQTIQSTVTQAAATASNAAASASNAAATAANVPPPPASTPPPASGGSTSSSSSSSSSTSETKTETKTETKSENKTEEKKTESKSEEKKEESKSEEKKEESKEESKEEKKE